MKPVVGLPVLYYPSDDDIYYGRIEGDKGKPLAALVAWVNEDETVNLMVADRHGNPVGRRHVQLLQPDGPKPNAKSHSWAEWPQH